MKGLNSFLVNMAAAAVGTLVAYQVSKMFFEKKNSSNDTADAGFEGLTYRNV